MIPTLTEKSCDILNIRDIERSQTDVSFFMDKTEDRLSKLTFNQTKFLARLADSMDRAGYCFGQEESGVVATLLKEGFISRFGKNGPLQRYQLSSEVWDNPEARNYLRELAQSIAREEANHE